MYFLIQYDRAGGELVSVAEYADDAKDQAYSDRLDIELDRFRNKQDIEVVLLQAATSAAMKSTHRRYFSSTGSLAADLEESSR